MWSFTGGPSLAAVPSNDADAFKRLDLYLDRTAFQGTADHQNVGQYPSFLNADRLLAIRGPGDTICLVRSEPYDGIGMEVSNTVPQSFVEYAVSPPRYLTSVAVIIMGKSVFNGSGGFNDAGKVVARLTAHYVDATTSPPTDLAVGVHVRNFLGGSVFCGASQPPYYTAQPSSPLLGVLWQDLGSMFFYDINEIQLPANKRSVKVDLIRIEGVIQDHFCSTFIPHLYSGTNFHGLSAWPSFTVLNAQSQPVVRKSQSTNQPHGGYLFGGTVVGTRRATNRTACQVASMAMCYEYAGFPCTVDGLNAHLQQNKGYEPSNVAIVTWVSPTGDAIRYRAYTQDDTRLNAGDRFLVERGYYTNPLATFEVTTLGQATLFQTHNPTTPVVEGDVGRVYWNMKRRVADTFTQNPSLVSVDIGSSPQLPDQVEALLTQNIPVQLNLVTHGHMVVADGWVPSFRPDGTAKGTYSIKDPYDDRNFTGLIESRLIPGPQPKVANYANKFRLARYVMPPGGLQPLLLDSTAVASNGTPSLSVLTNGTWRVELIDPLGRRMSRDAGSGEDVAEIPGAWIMDVGSEHDNGADWDGSQTGYSMDVAQALDGDYLLRLYADAGHAVNVSSYDDTGVISSDAAGDTAIVPTGNAYNVHYSAALGAVAVTLLGPLGVREHFVQPNRGGLAVRRNPASGPVEFIIRGPLGADDLIDVFDTSGRRVGGVQVGPGVQAVSWHWSQVGCRPGVYLARLRSGSGAIRFVVVR